VIPAERDGSGWPRRPACGPPSSAISGNLDLAPGLSTQEFDVWLATGLTQGPTAREASEADMRSAFVSEAELQAMVRDGRFTDGPSPAAYSLLLLSRG
jgi:hypothetical protein